MLQKIYFMVFERYIPELKKYDSISFLHQPMTSGQPLKIVQRHMAHPVGRVQGNHQNCDKKVLKASDTIFFS